MNYASIQQKQTRKCSQFEFLVPFTIILRCGITTNFPSMSAPMLAPNVFDVPVLVTFRRFYKFFYKFTLDGFFFQSIVDIVAVAKAVNRIGAEVGLLDEGQ